MLVIEDLEVQCAEADVAEGLEICEVVPGKTSVIHTWALKIDRIFICITLLKAVDFLIDIGGGSSMLIDCLDHSNHNLCHISFFIGFEILKLDEEVL